MLKSPGAARIAVMIVCVFGAGALTACHSDRGPPPPTFSPNGEPLIGKFWPADCEEAEALWFDRLDTVHSGRLTLAQLQADAERQYKLMDLRHDGRVTAEELSNYRLKEMGGHYISVSTPDQKDTIERLDEEDDDSGGRRELGRYDRRGSDDTKSGKMDAFAALTTDQPDPVMSADTDLDGSVTLEEFRTLVDQNFAEFDKEHAGYITKPEVIGICALK
jgi:Ca2+-binding EF-hand superfamily protein